MKQMNCIVQNVAKGQMIYLKSFVDIAVVITGVMIMRMVIEIPNSIYNTIENDEVISREWLMILQKHILDGTVLPEQYGRLIDADALLTHKTDHEYISTHIIYNAPTILEGTVKV